ncbi:family 20 glycosylhydrolase [Vibrio sp. SM6]|uniref:beta-N-acetylhexosaminidase n=1 Tax=Vibrio agarilyticus TaxID=2726741 RepID=A0A7X8TND0_9VIBR|nr:beta-N-acetylhexosaminidase [Vibrio agarilyticus]NLS11642.1 family 20 glycosylhydrolase [Vibrio agarilyticus]
MFKRNLIAATMVATLAGCATVQSPEQSVVNTLANNLDIHYQVVTNHGANEGIACQDLGAEWASCNKVIMTLINEGEAVAAKDWAIYFHSVRLILDVQNEQFKITRVTGDLHKLEPTEKFDGFAAGEVIEIPYVGEYWQLFATDFFPGAFVTAPNAEPKRIASLDTEEIGAFVSGLSGDNLKRTPDDNNVIATAATRYEKNVDTQFEDVSTALIPSPLYVEATQGTVKLANGIALSKAPFTEEQWQALETRAEVIGVDIDGALPMSVVLASETFSGEMARSGAYKLVIGDEGIEVTAFDQAGAFYAVQSVFGLMDSNNTTSLPKLRIQDAPRFDYRGIMVDVARNFHSKAAILATLDQMAAYKMNKLHLHLSDDEGWRLEIPGLPELTNVGSQRCFDLNEQTCLLPQLGSGPDSDNFGSGFFSKADYVEILQYAKARHIEVIPEIDMPAHARAAVISMEARYTRLMNEGNEAAANEYRLMDPNDTSNVTTVQFYNRQSFINPCMDSSTRFVDKVISEVMAMHNEAGMPLTTWHFGGDEAKNIKLGAGFQDIHDANPVAWKGSIDLSKQDKPFARSPECARLIENGVVTDYGHLPSYFAAKVSQIAANKGLPSFQAWQDGLKYNKGGASDFATANTRVNFWDVLYWGGNASAYEWAEKGYDLILSNPDYVYMDFPYEVDAQERGYYWGTRATDTRKMFGFAPENLPQNAETSVDRDGNGFSGKGTTGVQTFHGLSAQLWSETVRTDEQYEYMVFPRVLAAAERAWHRGEWENDYQVGVEYTQQTDLVNKVALHREWQRFANVMGQRELAKLEKSDIDYRLPVPGAIIEAGKLMMNVQFPGVSLQYSTDGQNWQTYSEVERPTISGEVWVRSVSASGEKNSRAILVDKSHPKK